MPSPDRSKDWYRSQQGPPGPREKGSLSRRVRNWLRGWLPEPDVRGKMMVLHARQGFPKLSAWAGMFSEFHSVLGALAYAEAHGAAGVRVDFRSPLYLDPHRGPNWWTYFFDPDEMRTSPSAGARDEVHLKRRIAKYGRHGGFCDDVNGTTPYLYPMTYGIDREELHRLLTTHVRVRPEILDEVARWIAASVDRDAYVAGVHYRGTDSTHGLTGWLTDDRVSRVPYETYALEVRSALDAARARTYQLLIASDESDFIEFMRREFPGRVVSVAGAPRARAGGRAVHFDRTLAASNYEKGKSGLVDCLLLASTNYLVKGRSNLSDASLVFNPRLPYSFCVR
jgi:hypothetical protein